MPIIRKGVKHGLERCEMEQFVLTASGLGFHVNATQGVEAKNASNVSAARPVRWKFFVATAASRCGNEEYGIRGARGRIARCGPVNLKQFAWRQ